MLKSNFFLFPLIGYRKIADCIASVSHFLTHCDAKYVEYGVNTG